MALKDRKLSHLLPFIFYHHLRVVRWSSLLACAANSLCQSSSPVLLKSSANDGFHRDHSAKARQLLVRVLPERLLVKDWG